MVKRLQANLILCASLWLAAGVLLCAGRGAFAQTDGSLPARFSGAGYFSRVKNERPVSGKASQPPGLTIPIEQLGFTAPVSTNFGQRNCFVSLDFLDENRLLFTFRVPGLIRREAAEEGGGQSGERRVRAVVLSLPDGAVEAETLWTLHDPWRFLWMLKDGHFLLRDQDGLQQGDATLALKPFLHFSGPLLWLDMDPQQQFLVASSRELAPAPLVTVVPGGKKAVGQTDYEVRVLRRESGQVMLVGRARSTVHLPINSEGYLESLRGKGAEWLLNLHSYSGGSRLLGRVESTCPPSYDFVSDQEVLATVCTAAGTSKLIAMSSDGRHLWEFSTPATSVWPLLMSSQDGSRLVRETLDLNYTPGAFSFIVAEDVRGQSVEVFDAATGKVALTASVNPALDEGGNVAISPSGRRVAVLNGGAIQVFELPAVAGVPGVAGNQVGR